MTSLHSNWHGMSLQRRLVLVNACLLLVVALNALTMFLHRRQVPSMPDIGALAPFEVGPVDAVEKSEVGYQYEGFGGVNIFQTLIARPAAPEPPPPPKKPDPNLASAIESWKVIGIAKGVAFMEDKRTHEEWLMDLMDPVARTKVNTFQGVNIEVKLESLDEIYLNAVFTYQGPQGLQTVTKSVFDEE